MKRHTLAFVDLEMSGLDVENHEILEIGLIVVKQKWLKTKGLQLEVKGEYEWKVQPEHIETADPESLAVCGYKKEKWRKAVPIRQVLKEFSQKTRNTIMVGHNVTFDYMFLNKAFYTTGIKNTMHYHKLDTISIAYAKMCNNPDIEKFSLRKLCEYFDIKNKNAHTALSDTRATFELFKKLVL